MRCVVGLAAVATLFAAAPAQATSARDAAVVARAVSFVQGGPTGEVSVAVVDGPGADAAVAAFGSGVAAGAVTLKARKVPLSALAGSGAKVVLVPEGQSGVHAEVAEIAKRMRALTVSSELSCVQAGHCVMGVRAEPRVEIVVSRAAAAANGVAFQSAFRVMIREL
jgi:hypothetical protein